MIDKPLSERLPDGRYAINPDAIQWDDIRPTGADMSKAGKFETAISLHCLSDFRKTLEQAAQIADQCAEEHIAAHNAALAEGNPKESSIRVRQAGTALRIAAAIRNLPPSTN